MSKWKISLYLTALFLAGAVTGAFVTCRLKPAAFMHPPRPGDMAAQVRNELERKLALSPEQVRQITPFINDSMKEFRIVLADQMVISMSNCNARIATVLTPEQKVKFVEIEQQQRNFIHGTFKKAESPLKP